MGQTWSADFDTSGVVSGATAGRDSLVEMRDAALAAAEALKTASGASGAGYAGVARQAGAAAKATEKATAAARAGEQAAKASAGRYKLGAGGRVQETTDADDLAKARAKSGEAAAKALRAREQREKRERDKRVQDEAKAANERKKDADERSKKEAKSARSALRGAGTLLAATAGVAGFAGLAKVAIGVRAMAQLQVIQQRTAYGFTQLFRGVDASPLVRAAELFSRNFTGQTVTGKAMGDVLTRSFNALFRVIEAGEPYITAFTGGVVLGMLYVEQAILRARIAWAPYAGALDGIVTTSMLAKAGTIGLGVGLVAMAGYAAVAAAPFLALAAAVLAVAAAFEQASKLAKEWDENSSSQIWRKLKSDLGVGGSQQDKERAQGIVQGDDFDKAQKAKGQAVGKAMGDGMVAGMAASEAAVAAGGGKLAKAAEAGAKAAAEIRSPSRKMRREVGRQLGEGVARGEEDMADRVQRAAASSLVPDPARLPSLGGSGAGGASITGPLVTIGQLVISGGEDFKELVLDGIEGAAARAAATLGLAVPARS